MTDPSKMMTTDLLRLAFDFCQENGLNMKIVKELRSRFPVSGADKTNGDRIKDAPIPQD